MTVANDYKADPRDRSSEALKASARRRQRATRASPVKWTINEKFGLGRDQSQFIIYQARTPKLGKPQHPSETHKAVALFTSLEAAMMWMIMRQVHFPDDPTIDTDILDAFQAYCHRLDRVKADVKALVERMETALASNASYRDVRIAS